ncbi:potassium-transporting ATPase subunit KdpC [Fluviicola taffensis]|uniref:Potassium-transporting ATPase KdpC subunit n=1 Tax=Fluviicola taffensis (strain DSM 16823 / NCIMB 13979 / RW262) TaxID=755732 RepID=F2IFU3_FLUTR|nr:potassium-transporting ATPase subunit KdpC [Fluviicola taffensis]AEA42551.1 Potassium-transporting ATPase C chain [Fluviicola taffensis DSM 16823]
MIKKIISVNIFTFLCMILLSVAYPLLISGIGKLAPGHGKGRTVSYNRKTVGFAQEGQQFTANNYFWGRPSAVNYNGAGSGGSNKGPSNPDYLKEVEARIDTFLLHHPYLDRKAVPAEMVTASGSGLDPHISPKAAEAQIKRVAQATGLKEQQLRSLVEKHTGAPLLNALGPKTINVLELNLALKNLQINKK